MLNYIENLIIFCLVSSSFLVLFVNNPVQSLLSLIVTFGLSAMIFMHLGVEFLSLLIFMVYIGAIAVLFLFVIMMLNVKIVELRSTYLRYLPIGIFIMFLFIVQLSFIFYCQFPHHSFLFYDAFNFDYLYLKWVNFFDFRGNIYLLGSIIYGFYFHIFLLLALILFLSMIGCIVLISNWKEEQFTTTDPYIISGYRSYSFWVARFNIVKRSLKQRKWIRKKKY